LGQFSRREPSPGISVDEQWPFVLVDMLREVRPFSGVWKAGRRWPSACEVLQAHERQRVQRQRIHLRATHFPVIDEMRGKARSPFLRGQRRMPRRSSNSDGLTVDERRGGCVCAYWRRGSSSSIRIRDAREGW
jgi:hypothetical protein